MVDLVEFTGMSITDVTSAIERKGWSNTRQDFSNMNPQSPGEVIWFNKTNRTFLFECAIHPPWEALTEELPGPILDYGAGLGTDCIWLYSLDNIVYYYDINMPCIEFFKWRCKKYGFDIQAVTNPWVDDSAYGTIIFRDVLEHIHNYEEVLNRADERLYEGGVLFVQAPFEAGVKFGVHMEEKIPVESWLKERRYKKMTDVKWIKGEMMCTR